MIHAQREGLFGVLSRGSDYLGVLLRSTPGQLMLSQESVTSRPFA